MIDWHIRPLESVGPIHFGMPRAQVALVLGPVEFSSVDGIDLTAPIPAGQVLTDFRIWQGGTDSHQPEVKRCRIGRGNAVRFLFRPSNAATGEKSHPVTRIPDHKDLCICATSRFPLCKLMSKRN